MDMNKYFKTLLEQSIEEYYIANGILTPDDLVIDRIAEIFDVDVAYNELRTFSDNELRVIFICLTDDLNARRLSFFHELCHVLRHAGDQRRMPELFLQLQEADADRFSLYAALPFFMLETIRLPQSEDEAAGLLGKVFQVPPKLAKERLTQIKERISGVEFMESFTYTAAAMEERIPEPINSDPVIRGIYGLEDLSRPHTLVIEQREGFDWESPLHIEVDGCFKSVDSQSHSYRDGAVVRSGDLKIPRGHAGYVTIDMGRIASRHGQTANRLFLPMEAVDDAINF
ncbi:Zn-dependent peptidase ImmA (M78 family) [Paenibacillus forsythiae]|uniref:Zn-dependent peptidase ImmA (M78 family) n=1 Tax=Paenibacillus forsythiae TaxID=365616 RepID=A0ABU3H6P2_9BACL|nr:ImmA/IrrE family metallo-endopeptidase [Paenibacillus forsythiae]MDT3426121.1 Zn-dependent peptidase ImmA (M78 family) [Paenibacillus forsythiae]